MKSQQDLDEPELLGVGWFGCNPSTLTLIRSIIITKKSEAKDEIITFINATTISTMSATVDIPASVKDQLKKLRFSKSKSNSAISFKINKSKLIIEEDESFDSFDTIEELAEELPGNNPRYVVVSYLLTHTDGRSSTPLFMINWSPTGAAPEAKTLHASALSLFQQTADVAKVIEVREGTETLTTEFLEGILLG